MRELKVVGLDVDGKRLICEGADASDKFVIKVDNRLRAAVRGDKATSNQTQIEVEVSIPVRATATPSRPATLPSVSTDGNAGSFRVVR